MKKHKLGLTVFTLSILLLWPTIGQAKPTPKKPAPHPAAAVSVPQQAALSWLSLVDAAKYTASWDAASPTFQAAVTKDQWATAVQGVRGPLGKIKSRVLKSGQHTTTLPGAPPGDYSVLLYNTTFEKQGASLETVVLIHDKDGKWRVSGYFIKPSA